MAAMRALTAAASAVLTTALGVTALTVAVPAPAGAAVDRCVTRGEYAAVRQGMTIPRVKRVVGYNGSLDSRVPVSQDYRIEKRRYRLCWTRASVAELGFVSVSGGPYKLTRKEITPR